MSTARLLRLPQLARALTLALTLVLTIGLFAPGGQAVPVAATPNAGPHPAAGPTTGPTTGPTDPPMPGPATEQTPERGEAERQKFLTPDSQAPVQLAPETRQPAQAPAAKAFGQGAATAGEAVSCTPGDFSGRSGAALVQQVASVDFWCVNGLFVLSAQDGRWVFDEARMATVANAAREAAARYQGDNSGSVVQLFYYLQAGFFWQSNNKSVLGPYGTETRAAVRAALDAFFANPRSRDVTAANADPLERATVLLDCLRESARYLPIVKQQLNAYTDASWGPADLAWSVNPVLTLLFTGHAQDGFVDAVRADPSVLDALNGFILRNQEMLRRSADRRVLFQAANEFGRFLKYADLRPKLRPLVAAIAAKSDAGDHTRHQLASLTVSVNTFDAANCAAYGTCDAPQRLRDANLAALYTCSPSIRIRSQQTTAEQRAATCASLTGQDAFFHAVARDKGPVADDRNTQIEVVVFDAPFEYQALAAAIYGIRTDNGGMYLEGDPAKADNEARFVAYEADWNTTSFEIWNLNHEYTHYLDARFTMYGTFEEGYTTPTVWWTEGFAEYLAHSYVKSSNEAARAVAGQHTYRLSTLFDTTYENTDQDRTYRWGYLAVRYMMEQRRGDLDAVLAEYRTGDWAGARTLLKDTIGTRLDADFDAWLTRCAAGACAVVPTVPVVPQLPQCAGADPRQLGSDCGRGNVAATTGNYAHFYVWVPAGTRQIKVTTGGGTGNGDLRYNPGGWAYTDSAVAVSAGPDNSETLTVTDPPAGYVFFSLHAREGFSGVSVTSEF